MKRLTLSLLFFCVFGLFSQTILAKDTFQYPKKIEFKLLKNGGVLGKCSLIYKKTGKFEGTFSLKLIDFQGFGIKSRQWLVSYVFHKDNSIYATYVMEGKAPFSEIRLKEGIGFDLKKGNLFVYKEYKGENKNINTELMTTYPVIDLVSAYYITSRKVAGQEHKNTHQFNFLFGKSTKIMSMVHIAEENVIFKGKPVPTSVLAITYNNVEIFRFKIFRDSDGFCYPVSVTVASGFDNKQSAYEMRASEVYK